MLKKVYRLEFAELEKFSKVAQQRNLSRDQLFTEFDRLVDAYRTLLVNTAKLTKIGDINQKKLFASHTSLEEESAFHYQSSITDPLTQLYNRGYLMSIIEHEFAESVRYGKTVSCVLGDIDNFKSVNDNFGHLAGDAVLKKVAEVLKSCIRETDVLGRYGGEEFLIILPNERAADALIVAEKVRRQIAQINTSTIAKGLSLSISLGVADTLTLNPSSEDEFLLNVDTALYIAKEQGKNCCVLFQGGPQSK